jgi:branched-chain amino acid transport system substrate-binding protein
MSNKIVITITDGSFEKGFDIKVNVGRNTDEQHGRLPPQPEIPALYRENFSDGTLESNGEPRSNNYRTWVRTMTHDTESLPMVAQHLDQRTTLLETQFTNWLSFADLGNIQTQIGKKIPLGSQPQVILQVPNDRILQRLPWHKWAWFNTHFPDTEIVLSRRAFKVKPFLGLRRVLVIVGTETTIDQDGNEQRIDLKPDLKALEKNLNPIVADFKVKVLPQPTLKELRAAIRDGKYHIIFYVGHSNGDDGSIGVNRQENITIHYLNDEIRAAVRNGLEMMLFNSCNGSEIAFRLSDWNVPYIIVMRERIANDVAVTFIEHFSQHLAEGHSLTKSVSKAREQLRDQEGVQRCASWMPMIFQSLQAPDYIPFPKFQTIFLRIVYWFNQQSNWLKVTIGALIISLAIISTAGVITYFNRPPNPPDRISIPTPPTVISQQIESSIGDRSLFSKKFKYTQSKADAIKHFNLAKKGSTKYSVANADFTKAHDKTPDDPEPVIYGNNAQVLNEVPDQTKSLTIPITSSATSGFSTHVEVLRGAALAQMEINKRGGISINGEQKKVLLKIYLDDNNPAKANEVATEIAENYRQVVGHVDSKISLQVAGIYENKEVIMLTATSSAPELGQKKYKYTARTMPDAEIMAKYLAEYINKVGKKRIAIFRHGEDAGIKFEGLISKELKSKKIDVLDGFNMSASSFSARKVISKMINENRIDGLLIYTHLNESNNLKSFIDILQAVKEYDPQGKVSLFGSHSLISTDLIELGKDANFANLNDMTFVTPKHPDITVNGKPLQFTKDFKSIFGIEPTWRDMMAYDAVKAIAYGLNGSNGDNQILQAKLHSKVKIADGSSAPIEFSESGNRYLVPLITYFKCNGDTCKFGTNLKIQG